ncbi:Protein of unknown function [Bacillus mycoides]|nr:Protein of unknown function [Bacillus mycoides]
MNGVYFGTHLAGIRVQILNK